MAMYQKRLMASFDMVKRSAAGAAHGLWEAVKRRMTPKEGSKAALYLEKAQPYLDRAALAWRRFLIACQIAWVLATIWSSVIVELWLFKVAINFCIAANVGLMSLRSFPADETLDSTVAAFDTTFTIIFFIEMLLKLLAYGNQLYWSSGWNAFDGTISVLCIVAVFVEGVTGVTLPAITVLRGFRVLRVVRLLRSAEAIKTILFTLIMSFPAVANVSILMLLFFLIYASLGVPLFYNVRWAEEFTGGINSFTNFQGFGNAFATLFTISTGDGWVGLMHSTFFDDGDYSCELDVNLDEIYLDETGCGSKVAGLFYFISFYVLHTYVVLNMLVVIVIDSYSTVQESGARSSSSGRSIEGFAEAWRRLDPAMRGMIPIRELRDLLTDWNPLEAEGSMRANVRLLRKASRYMTWHWERKRGGAGWTRCVSLESAFYAVSRVANPKAVLPPSPMLSNALRVEYRTSRRRANFYKHMDAWGAEKREGHAARVIQFAVTVMSENARTKEAVTQLHELEDAERERGSWYRSWREGGGQGFWRAVRVWYAAATRGRLRIGRSEHWGAVVVGLVRARNLPETSRAGKCDAFVTVTCGPSKAERSNLALDTYDPVWNEKFAFDVKGTADAVDVKVWDDDVVANRFVGSCVIPVSAICTEPNMQVRRWYEISGERGEARGNTLLDVAVETFKWELDVDVLECRGLPRSFIREAPHEEMNPYCCVVLGHKVFATTPRQGAFSPAFRERLHFDLNSLEEELRVVVLNNKPDQESGDDFVAQATVRASELLHLDNLSVSYISGKRHPGSWSVSLWLPLAPEDGVAPWGQLKISIVEARGLPKMDAFGKVDPFCIVRVVRPDGPQDMRGLKTQVRIATFEPKWHEDFAFDVMDEDSMVVVEVYDHDWGGDAEQIGVVRLPLKGMCDMQEPYDAWHEVKRAEEGGASAIDGSLGQIRLMTNVETRGVDYAGSFGYVHLRVGAQLLTDIPTLRDLGEESRRMFAANPDEPADLVDGHLHIAVMEGRDLPNMGGIEASHAFAEVSVVGNHTRFVDRTRVERSRMEIQWCDEFTVKRLEHDAELVVSVQEPVGGKLSNDEGAEVGRVTMHIRRLLALLEAAKSGDLDRASSMDLPGEGNGSLDRWFDLDCGGQLRLVVSLGPRVGASEYADMDQFVTRGILRDILQKDAERIRQEQRDRAVEVAMASHMPTIPAVIPLPVSHPPPLPDGGGLRGHGSRTALQNPVRGLRQAGVGRTSRETPLRALGGLKVEAKSNFESALVAALPVGGDKAGAVAKASADESQKVDSLLLGDA